MGAPIRVQLDCGAGPLPDARLVRAEDRRGNSLCSHARNIIKEGHLACRSGTGHEENTEPRVVLRSRRHLYTLTRISAGRRAVQRAREWTLLCVQIGPSRIEDHPTGQVFVEASVREQVMRILLRAEARRPRITASTATKV